MQLDLSGPSEVSKSSELTSFLSQLRRDHDLPAIAAGAMRNGQMLCLAAVGVRKVGDPAQVMVSDKFHIGSCTKAMTASLAAMLVVEGKLRWGSTLAEIFPERAEAMLPSYRKVTLEWLLTHRSGAPANSTHYGRPGDSVTNQRLAYLDSVVSKSPDHEPGTRYSYSNAGYIIAGAILERRSGRTWEELIQERLFRPLRMASAGFGPPSKPRLVDQPWGHILREGHFVARYGDNPRALGPAGTVHCSVEDYLKFADWHASCGLRPPGLLAAASFAKLHQVVPGQDYAMGWGAAQRGWAEGQALTHAGSNTMNYFVVWVAPSIGLSLAIASNCAGDPVPAVLDRAAGHLVQMCAGEG
jgi:CubicO group peptidase (beta-lactamase class C family)